LINNFWFDSGAKVSLLSKVIDDSELFSLSEREGSEVPLETFALNSCVPETLSEVVLGAVSASVTSVANHGNDQFPVFLIVRKNPLETVAQIIEVSVLRNLGLNDAWFDTGCRFESRKGIKTHAMPRFVFQEVPLSICHQYL